MVALRHLPLEKILVQSNIIFEIGSESCSIKFCNEIQTFIENSELCLGKKFRIVSPKVPQAYIEPVVKCILQVIDRLDIETIIINDYGILYELRKAGVKKKFIFGRLLVRSQEYEHNYLKRIDPLENEDVLESWLNPNILHKSKLEFLKLMNFTGVELSPSDSVKNLLLNIKEFDFDVYVHYNSMVGATGRACVCAKHSHIKPENCSELCETKYNLQLSRMYGNFSTPTQEEINMFSRNVVIGNIVYFVNEVKDFPFDKCRDVIIDTRINDNFQEEIFDKNLLG